MSDTTYSVRPWAERAAAAFPDRHYVNLECQWTVSDGHGYGKWRLAVQPGYDGTVCSGYEDGERGWRHRHPGDRDRCAVRRER